MFQNKILLATDLSETSAAAEKTAFALAESLRLPLVILHVIPERASLGMSTIPPELAAPELLHRRLQQIGVGQTVKANRMLMTGSPAATILRIAESEAVDLIVVGTRGRSGVSRVMLGSVADDIVRQSTCPVMLVRS